MPASISVDFKTERRQKLCRGITANCGQLGYYPFAARTGMRARQRRRSAPAHRRYGAAGGGCFASAPDCRPRRPAGLRYNLSLPSAGGNGRKRPRQQHHGAPVAATYTPCRHTGCRRCRSRHPGGSTGCPHQEVLPAYRDLYEQNPDLIGWLTIDGTDIDLPVVQTPGNNEYYLRRGFDRLYATGGTLFMDEHCPSIPTPPPPTG